MANEENQSTSIAALSQAMSKAQGEMQSAVKDGLNPHFKSHFATLLSAWEAVKGALTKNGLCIYQTIQVQNDWQFLVTTLAHSSGEWIKSFYPIVPDKPGPQGFKSAITYARRTSLLAMCSIPEEDDDAEAATSRTHPVFQTKQSQSTASKQSDIKRPTEAQIKRLWAIAASNGYTEDGVKNLYAFHNLNSSKELSIAQYNDICEYMELHPVPMPNIQHQGASDLPF